MGFLTRLSIRSQIAIYSGASLVLFATIALFYFNWKYRSQTENILTDKSRSIAQMLALNAAAGVTFDDAQSVGNVLQSVRQDPLVEAVYVSTPANPNFSAYTREGRSPLSREAAAGRAKSPGAYVFDDYIIVRENILSGSEVEGYLLLVTPLETVRRDIMIAIGMAALTCIVTIILGEIMLFVLANSMLSRLREAAETARRISSGNLDVPTLTEDGRDEISRLNQAINVMVKSLKHVLGQILEASEPIKRSSSEIQTSTVQQRHGIENQATAISEITTTINELKTTSKQSAAIAQHVLDDSERSVEVSREGAAANEKAVAGMKQIRDQMETIAQTIMSLSERSQQISDIVATVNDLAQQSNFLALNASIEAAKAGEHGKGFAVVAMEVRNLAEQSQQATAQIRGILSEVQSATNSAVLVTENGTLKVSEGVEAIERTGRVIGQLAEVVNQAATSARQISASANQQSVGIEQIAQAMASISQTMNETTASAKQLERTAEWLAEVGKKMTAAIERYTTH